jgi:tetratricopeptide (TPR) repeat protein
MPRERIIRSPLDGKSKTLKDLSGDTGLPEDPLSALLGRLIGDRLISREETERKDVCFSLDSGIETYVKIAGLFLNDEGRFDFLVSDYSESMVNSRLADYIESRYHIMLSETEKQELIKLLRISPLALHAALFSPTERYDTGHAHAEQMGLRGDERDKWNKLLVTEFILTLLEKATVDLHDPDSKTTLSKNNVEGYDIRLKLMMANQRELTLGLGTEAVVLPAKAAGPVKAGQRVSATDPDRYVWTGDILLHLELFQRAIAEYDRAISEMKDRDKLAAAWNNKGVCYMALKEWSKAIPCFEKALEFNPSMIQARENTEKCRHAREE